MIVVKNAYFNTDNWLQPATLTRHMSMRVRTEAPKINYKNLLTNQ